MWEPKRIISALLTPFSGVRSSHTDIPALREENAQEEEEQEHAGTNPAVGCVRGRGIEVGLVVLRLIY